MKIIFRLLIIAACCGLLLSFIRLRKEGAGFAIVNVNVIPMDRERLLKHQTILIENGKIKEIKDAEKIKVPEGFITIDGNGKYLMPGLFDMHAHFFYEEGQNVNTCEAELKVMLSNGLTTVR